MQKVCADENSAAISLILSFLRFFVPIPRPVWLLFHLQTLDCNALHFRSIFRRRGVRRAIHRIVKKNEPTCFLLGLTFAVQNIQRISRRICLLRVGKWLEIEVRVLLKSLTSESRTRLCICVLIYLTYPESFKYLKQIV